MTFTPPISPVVASAFAATSPDDYDVVRRAVAYISEHWRSQPEIEAIAHASGVTPDELARVTTENFFKLFTKAQPPAAAA